MENEDWQSKYITMRTFYEDRLKFMEDIVNKSMEMNCLLMDMLQRKEAEEKFGKLIEDEVSRRSK